MTNRRPDPADLNNTLPADGKERAQAWFRQLRDDICAEFEAIEGEYADAKQETSQQASEPSACEASSHVKASRPSRGHQKFERTPWNRPEGGGGEMSIMRGRVFEKVGVNISTVHSKFSESFQKEIPGGEQHPYFWASGISLVAHMRSPLVPAVHMNTRMICLANQSSELQVASSKNAQLGTHHSELKTLTWFGGGADLTPMYPDDTDTADFHQAFKQACDAYDPAYHPKYKAWCDEYFHLKHRDEPRGVGGIFYDYLSEGPAEDGWQRNFDFTKEVGRAFLAIYPKLVRRHMLKSWSDEQRQWQLEKRGRYVEFNLLQDRGTRFGLMTGGNTEAILMSMPPEARWP